jgi:hypothetical protein
VKHRCDTVIFVGSRGTYCRVAYNFAFLFATRKSSLEKERSRSGNKYNFLLLSEHLFAGVFGRLQSGILDLLEIDFAIIDPLLYFREKSGWNWVLFSSTEGIGCM